MNSTNPEAGDNIKQRERRMRRVRLWMGFYAGFIGLFTFFSVAGNSRFEKYHKLDVSRLVIAGAGFGVALVSFIQHFKTSGDGSEAKKE